MKVSRRIAQFLLVLLGYEKPRIDDKLKFPHPYSRHDHLKDFFYRRIHHLFPDYFGQFKPNNTLRSSFSRTICIMLRQGLISRTQDFYERVGDRYSYDDIVLTEKGKKRAIALKEEALRYIEDFSFLLDRKTSSAPNVRD